MSQIKFDWFSPVLGVYVAGIEISPDNLAQSAQQIREWLDRYLVVVVREQSLTASEQRDLVFWDNRFTLHYPINDFTDHKRLLLRCTALEA